MLNKQQQQQQNNNMNMQIKSLHAKTDLLKLTCK